MEKAEDLHNNTHWNNKIYENPLSGFFFASAYTVMEMTNHDITTVCKYFNKWANKI